jgi:hypothetical protein
MHFLGVDLFEPNVIGALQCAFMVFGQLMLYLAAAGAWLKSARRIQAQISLVSITSEASLSICFQSISRPRPGPSGART